MKKPSTSNVTLKVFLNFSNYSVITDNLQVGYCISDERRISCGDLQSGWKSVIKLVYLHIFNKG
jgi:hypothetical protein